MLLGIVAGDEPLDVTTSAGDYDRATRPDAWIYGDHYGILIESKLTKEVNPEQWAKHKQLLGEDCTERQITWDNIYKFFRSLRPVDDKERLLLEQFVQYLEYAGLVNMETLTHEHFDYLWNPEDADGKRWIRSTMRGIAKALTCRLSREDLNTEPGNLFTTPEGYYGS